MSDDATDVLESARSDDENSGIQPSSPEDVRHAFFARHEAQFANEMEATRAALSAAESAASDAREALEQRRVALTAALADAEVAARTWSAAMDASEQRRAQRAEQRANATAERMRRQLARAEKAVQGCDEQVTSARFAYDNAAALYAEAAWSLTVDNLVRRQEARLKRERELWAELFKLAEEGRADNREATRLQAEYEQRNPESGRSNSEGELRSKIAFALYLPGVNDLIHVTTRKHESWRRLMDDGVGVIYAADLAHALTAEADSHQYARTQQGDKIQRNRQG